MPERQQPSHVETAAFHGHDLIVIPGDTPEATYVVLKPIVEAMGLQWHAQRKRIHRNEVLREGASMMDLPSVGGVQTAMCLPLTRLNFWLATIETSRVRPDLRETILNYQRECADALYAHFFGAQTPAETVAAASPLRALTPQDHGRLARMGREIRLSVGRAAAARFLLREGVITADDAGPAASGIEPLSPPDAVKAWIAARLEPADAILPNAIAYADFCAWAMANGQIAQTPVAFGKHSAEAGLIKGNSGPRRVIRGVALRARAEDAQG